MKVVQAYKRNGSEWVFTHKNIPLKNPLVLVFGNRFMLEDTGIFEEVKNIFPYKHIVFGSSAGEIIDTNVFESSLVVTAIEFEKSSFHIQTANIIEMGKGADEVGQNLASSFRQENLKHLFVLSEGSMVNGSALISGIEDELKDNISLTGGMCGDDSRFQKTLASYNEAPKEGEVIAIGLYGESLEISFASFGGWVPFGPERIITRSEGNVLYELDNAPALDIYVNYLGDKASELPQSSLLYPLNVKAEGKSKPVVRTILNINNEDNSMILAGDAPVNSRAQLMMASVDGIVSGAYEAAKQAIDKRKQKPSLALLVSCIGRKLVLDQRVEEEIEEVRDVLGPEAIITGFYSYGEMAPFQGEQNCELHNQTMTLTLFSE